MAVSFGINKHDGALTESVGIEQTTEVATLRGSKGATKYVRPYDRMNKFSLKTRGEESDLEVGVGDPGISGLTAGVVVIESVKYDETNTDFPSAEASGTHYPEAEEVVDDEG
jgi:hypothetical protein